MNEFLDLRIDAVHYRGSRGGVILSGNCMLSGNRYIASINRDELLDLPVIRRGKIWRFWGVEKECELQFPHDNVLETMIYVTKAQDLSSTYENIVNFIVDEDKIGLSTSRQLLEHFEADLIRIIANREIALLQEILPEKTAELLCDTFASASSAEASRFLDRFGISQEIINKITVVYGAETIQKIIDDPYRLLSFGVSWGEVDAFATTYCHVETKSPLRLHAAIEEALYRACEDGSTAIKLKDLRGVLFSVLNNMPLVHRALALNDSNGQYRNIDNFYYPAGAWLVEKRIADWVIKKDSESVDRLLSDDELKSSINRFQGEKGFKLSASQKSALKQNTTKSLSLLIGVNGVGKSTALECLYQSAASVMPVKNIYRLALNATVIERMSDLSSYCTTYSLFNFIQHARRHSIPDGSLIVLEEANTIDNVQFYRFINVLPETCFVVLAGDAQQLAPLGVGSVLHALASLNIPKTILHDQYVSSGVGSIPYVLQAVQQGIWRGIKAYSAGLEGVSFLSCSNSDIDHNVLELYKRLSEEDEAQVICPTQSGSGGADTLNALIQPQANMSLDELTYLDQEFGVMSYRSSTGSFTVGDKVVYTKNNANNGLREGSLGVIVKKLRPTKTNSPICKIDFGTDGIYNFIAEELECLEMAYAITAHRSQGYQFKSVIIPIRQSRFLERSLLYMAISRGVERVILVGNREAAINAVEKIAESTRTVGLARLIAKEL